MADSPGKVLSSFTSSDERQGSSTKLGGCAGMFFQLLDRFNSKKLFPHKLLPSERPEHNTISHTEEKLPMAKLLLIADENRIGSSRKEGDSVLDDACQQTKDCKERQVKKSVGVVARLMGLETMPSPEPFREKKHVEVFKEAQSTRKLLQSRPVLGGKRGKVINKRTKPLHIDQLHRFEAKISALNSVAGALKQSTTTTSSKCRVIFQSCETDTKLQLIEVEDAKALFFSKLPAMPSFQVESPLRSILSPSRTSSKVLSPIKSPLSSKRKVCLFGAAAKILQPSLHSARQLGFHPHNTTRLLQGSVGKDMNEKKMTMVAASSAPPLAETAAESRNFAAKHQLNLEGGGASSSSPSIFTECKGQVTSRHVNPSSERRSQSSVNEVNTLKRFISKQEQAKNPLRVRHERESNNKPVSEKKLATSSTQRQKVRSSTNDGGRLRPWQKSNKYSIKGSQLNSKQDNAALPVCVKEEIANQDEASKRLSRSIISRRQGFSSLGPRSTQGSSISTVSHCSRTDKSLHDYSKSMQASSEVMNQEGSGKCARISSPNIDKAMSSSKTTISGSQSKSIISAQIKGGSLSSRPSAKRKAGNCLVKPCAQEDVLTAVGGDFISDSQSEGITESFGRISPSICEEQSDLDAPRVWSLDGNNVISSDTKSVDHTRVRARWDIGDERKRNVTKNCISCQISDLPLADCHPGSSSLRAEQALQTTDRAAGILEELLLSLNTSTSHLCQDGSVALFDERKRSCRDLMDLSTDSSTAVNCFRQEAEQRPQSYDNFPLKEDTSIRDTESVSDSLCAEEFEQPSPISTLESPFQDSASSCSDSFDTSHGRTQLKANANELSDCMNIMGRQLEDLKIHDTQTMPDGNKFMDATSCVHCIDPGAMDVDATIDTVPENEDAYAKTLEAASFSAIWERLSLSGALLDTAVFNQLEIQTQHLLWRSTMTSTLCMENDSDLSPCKGKMCKSFTRCRSQSALQKRELIFECIEEALSLGLELAMPSYGFSVPYMRLPVAYFLKGVHQQIDEWKELAVSMNLDDMMKIEINKGMGRWFKFGDEVEKLAENIEAMIVRSLMDELMEVVIETPALCVCS